MDALYDLKEMLCKELEEYGKKELTAGTLDVVDKLAHTIKNIDKIIESEEESEGSYRGSYEGRSNRSYEGRSNRGSYRGESNRGSYRGRSNRSYNSYQRRDNMGRYSRDEDMVEKLRELMDDAPDDSTRQEIQRLVTKMEQM